MTKHSKSYTGLWIPRAVLEDAKLSRCAKLVFAMIDALDNQDGCWASNEYIAECLGINARYVRSTITDLVKSKYVSRHMVSRPDGQTSRVLRILQQDISSPLVGGILPTGGQEIASNRIRNNKGIAQGKGGSNGSEF